MLGRRLVTLSLVALLLAGCDLSFDPPGISGPSVAPSAAASIALASATSSSPDSFRQAAAQTYLTLAATYERDLATVNARFLTAGSPGNSLAQANLAAAKLYEASLTALSTTVWPSEVQPLVQRLAAERRTLGIVSRHLAESPGDESLVAQWQMADASATAYDLQLRQLLGLAVALAQPRPTPRPTPRTTPPPAATPRPTPPPSPTAEPGSSPTMAAIAGIPLINAAFFGPGVTVQNYAVTGNTPYEIWASIKAKGLDAESWTGGAEAYTQSDPTYHFSLLRYSTGTCEIRRDADPAITQTYLVVMPAWDPPPGVSSETIQWWAAELLRTARHERVHVQNGLRATETANQVLASSTCANVQHNLDAVWQAENLSDCQFDMSEYGKAAGLTLAACLAG